MLTLVVSMLRLGFLQHFRIAYSDTASMSSYGDYVLPCRQNNAVRKLAASAYPQKAFVDSF